MAVGKAKAKPKAAAKKAKAVTSAQAMAAIKPAAAPKAALKRPAASTWHEEQQLQVAPAVKAVKSTNQGSDAEDYEDGEADSRQTSRAQRYVFEANLDLVADADKAFYMTLGQKDCVHPGKMKERAKIVNAYVSRDASYTSKITPKERTLEQLTARTVKKNNEQQKQGLTKNVMIGSKFGASKELFQAALDDNEIWEEDGLYYSTSKTLTLTDEMSKTALGNSTWQGGDDKEFMSALADMMESSNNLKNLWLKDVQKKTSTTKQPMLADKDNKSQPLEMDYKMLQECFDSVTQVTNGMRKVAMELCKGDPTAVSTDLAKKGIQLCKDVIPSQDTIEHLLMTGKHETTKSEITKAMAEAAGPYKMLIEYYNELVAVHAHHRKQRSSGSSGSGGSKFKPIKL